MLLVVALLGRVQAGFSNGFMTIVMTVGIREDIAQFKPPPESEKRVGELYCTGLYRSLFILSRAVSWGTVVRPVNFFSNARNAVTI